MNSLYQISEDLLAKLRDLVGEDKVKTKLIVFETMDTPRVEQSLSPEYIEYKRRMRL